MSWVITGSEKTPVDPQFTSVALLLHAESLADSSRHNRTITANGQAAVSTTQKKFGNSSFVFDGSGDWLSVAYGPDLDLTSGDFTIEAWIWRNVSSANQGVFSTRTGAFGATLTIDADKPRFDIIGTVANVVSPSNFPTEQWSHLAVSRQGSSFRLFFDGTQVATSTSAVTGIPSTAAAVGARDANGNNALNGYIDEFRVTKGIARYTTNFTPPTAPFPDI
jgi:hypothetical protein